MDLQHDRVKILVVDVVGDSNHIERQKGVDELKSYGAAAVVPTIIAVLLDRGRTVRFWDDVVEGICRFLWDADAEFARPCAPAIVHLLATIGIVTSPDPIFLLDVLDMKAEIQDITYAIPALLDLIRSQAGDEVAITALHLLSKFSREQTHPYQQMIDEVSAGQQ
jgi:hypothetical protein